MTNQSFIEKKLAEFEERFHDGENRIGDILDNYSTDGIYLKVLNFLSESIDQAVEEERERIRKGAKKMKDKVKLSTNEKEESLRMLAIIRNITIDEFLSLLDNQSNK